MSITQRVFDVIRKDLVITSELTTSSTMGSLNADSLDYIKIIMDLEEEFSIHIPDEDADKLITVQDLVNYIDKALGDAQ